ncbi:putative prefoldin subunit 6 [Phyllosticta capitalensis]|uniref:putative prefoldin subunit 6 n=1 Tax=Phyllosticta capitalensis TaxID=121624 RepID=UPI00312ECB1F
MAEQQKQLQDLSDEFTTLQTELQTIVDGRQKLESQQQENQGVQAELDKIPSDANVYKLVGPVLLKQDKGDAEMAVKGRLEFIEKEMCVLAGTTRGLADTHQQAHREADWRGPGEE